MKEEYLHYLWRMKRLNYNRLKLINKNQSAISILETGWYNTDPGPDFFNGAVLYDGIRWSGNIEFHVKSSDWYLHKHHLDKAYNNVILHVVYEYDKEVIVEGDCLPTIELKNQIDEKHYRNYYRIVSNMNKVPCHDKVMHHKLKLLQQIDISFLQRIERKGQALLDGKEMVDKNNLFLTAIFKAVGGRTNALPMSQLAKNIPFNIIAKESWDSHRIEALLFGAAGLLNETVDEYPLQLKKQWKLLKNKYQLAEMNTNTWKFGGTRPYSFPTFLLAQLSAFLKQFDGNRLDLASADQIIERINNLDGTLIHPYWQTHFVFDKASKKHVLRFSKLFLRNLMINGIVPYLVALKFLKGKFTFLDTAVEIMEKLPPENNSVVKYWKNIGFIPKNAFESQGLLELNNEFCIFKKCLSCKVGNAILDG